MSERQKGLNNRNNAKTNAKKIYEHIENLRIDFHKELSDSIINADIIMEVSAVSLITKTHHFAKGITDAERSYFFTMLKPKSV